MKNKFSFIVHLQPVELRSPIVTVPVQSLFVKFVDTRNLLNYWSVNYPSSVWSVKLHRISKPIYVSNLLLLALSRKPVKPTWSVFSKTPICAPFTPNVLPSCQKISNWPAVFVVNVLKFIWIYSYYLIFLIL